MRLLFEKIQKLPNKPSKKLTYYMTVATEF